MSHDPRIENVGWWRDTLNRRVPEFRVHAVVIFEAVQKWCRVRRSSQDREHFDRESRSPNPCRFFFKGRGKGGDVLRILGGGFAFQKKLESNPRLVQPNN